MLGSPAGSLRDSVVALAAGALQVERVAGVYLDPGPLKARDGPRRDVMMMDVKLLQPEDDRADVGMLNGEC
jgi:hypothetical protein